jgi:hypothetical protein
MSKLAKSRIGDWLVALVAAAVSILVTWAAVQTGRQGDRIDHQDEQITALVQALSDEQSNAEAGGLTPVAPSPDDLLEDPEYEPLPGPSGPPGPAPTAAQIAAEVAQYFEEHPLLGQPSAAELAAAVASYLAEHPAEVPDERVYEAMAAYLTANPPPAGPPGEDGADGKDGADGADGDPGPPPTGAEIQEAVEAYFEANPLQPCNEPGFEYTVVTVLTPGPPTDILTCARTESTD